MYKITQGQDPSAVYLLICMINLIAINPARDSGDDVFYYQISTVKDLMLVINHFENYPLISENDFYSLNIFLKELNVRNI